MFILALNSIEHLSPGIPSTSYDNRKMYCLHSLKWQLHNSEEEISNGYSDLYITDDTSLEAGLALLVLHVMRYNNQLH